MKDPAVVLMPAAAQVCPRLLPDSDGEEIPVDLQTMRAVACQPSSGFNTEYREHDRSLYDAMAEDDGGLGTTRFKKTDVSINFGSHTALNWLPDNTYMGKPVRVLKESDFTVYLQKMPKLGHDVDRVSRKLSLLLRHQAGRSGRVCCDAANTVI